MRVQNSAGRPGWVVSVLLVSALVMSACSGSDSTSQGDPTSETEQASPVAGGGETGTPDGESSVDPASLDPGIDLDAKTIRLGGWRVATGPVAASNQHTIAAEAHIAKINEEGGFNGWTIEWDAPDAGPDPSQALEIAREQASSGDYFAFYDGMGSAQNAAVLPHVSTLDMPYFNPATSSPDICNFEPHIIHYPPLIASSGSLLGQYAYDELDARDFFVVYSRDANGEPGRAGVTAFIPTLDGAQVVGESSFAATDTDFSGVGRDVAAADPDAVLVFGAVPAAFSRSKRAALDRGIDAAWLGMNTFASPESVELDPDAMDGSYFYLAQTPFFQDDDPAVQEWRDTVSAMFPDASLGGVSQSGYAPVDLLELAVEIMTEDGQVPSRQGFIDAFQSIGQTGQIGMTAGVKYTDSSYEGINTYWVVQWKDDAWSVVQEPTRVPDFDYCSVPGVTDTSG